MNGNGLSLVATDGSSREPLGFEVPGILPRFMDGKLYWTCRGQATARTPTSTICSAPTRSAASVEEVVRIEGGEFRAGQGFVVWWQERTHFDPLVLDQNLVVLDERTGCAQPLPGVGLCVSYQA